MKMKSISQFMKKFALQKESPFSLVLISSVDKVFVKISNFFFFVDIVLNVTLIFFLQNMKYKFTTWQEYVEIRAVL